MNKKAFTLLELMVVIGIIGILSGFLIPTIGRAREAGRRAQCANNLRQIGIAWYLYLDDHDDMFPVSNHYGWWAGITGRTGYGTLTDDRPLNPYLGIDSGYGWMNREVCHCPSDKGMPDNADPNAGWFDITGNSYGMNEYLLGMYIHRFTTPNTKLWLVADMLNYHGNYVEGNVILTAANVLFMDGHVKLHDWTTDMDYYSSDPTMPIWDHPDGTP